MLKVLQVSPSFYPATYWGGPIVSTFALFSTLAARKHAQVRVLTTDTAGPELRNRLAISSCPVVFPSGLEVYYCHKLLGQEFSPHLLLHLFAQIGWADVVHLTGVYSTPTIPVLAIAALLRKPVVWSPRGSLQHWHGETRPKAKAIWRGICGWLVRGRRCVLHVTSKREAQESTERLTGTAAVLIPNGTLISENMVERQRRPGDKLQLVFLGRLHPIKAIENLLRALVHLGDVPLELAIYGDGDSDYVLKLKHLVAELGLGGCVHFLGHVDGAAKEAAFQRAELCIVPSHSENFGMVVCEALAHGVPVVASTGTPWNDLPAKRCGLWVSNDPVALALAIRKLNAADLVEMGRAGQAWVAREFTWERVALQMAGVYETLATGGMPTSVAHSDADPLERIKPVDTND